jgi:hypothetical protein
MKVYNDLISKNYQDELEDLIGSMPWYFRPKIANFSNSVDGNDNFKDPNVTDAPAFTHTFISKGIVHSEFFSNFAPILSAFEERENVRIDKIIRVRGRLTTPIPGHTLEKYNPPHVDLMSETPFKTLVYYVYDSDGDTIFFDKFYEHGQRRVKNIDLRNVFQHTPKKGHAVYFDGWQYHAGNTPVNYNSRCIINFDFTLKD